MEPARHEQNHGFSEGKPKKRRAFSSIIGAGNGCCRIFTVFFLSLIVQFLSSGSDYWLQLW